MPLKNILPNWHGTKNCAGILLEIRAFDTSYFSIQINLIGSDSQFIQYSSGIEQFIWGVFLCIDKKFSSQNIMSVLLETEDEPFRSINLNGVLMEIRAFDTTYFGIYSDCFMLISKISKIYDAEIEMA